MCELSGGPEAHLTRTPLFSQRRPRGEQVIEQFVFNSGSVYVPHPRLGRHSYRNFLIIVIVRLDNIPFVMLSDFLFNMECPIMAIQVSPL
jgi:hypothetical protein